MSTYGKKYVEFLDAGSAWDVSPEQAIDYFQAKGLKPSFAWQDMIAQEHDAAFTVAKMMDVDMLADVREAMDKALVEGTTFREFRKTLAPMLKAKGWWGKADVIDPATGNVVSAQLGSTARLRTIFRTNMQQSYAVGHWQTIKDQEYAAPYLMYDALEDHRTRESHARLDNLILPISDKFWRTHYPPNGWNCRCGVIQLDDEDLEDNGLKVSESPKIPTKKWINPRTGKTYKVPKDLDPGWDYNPGISRHAKLQELLAEKIAAMPPDAAAAALSATQDAIKAKAAYDSQLAASNALKTLAKAQGPSALARSKAKTVARGIQHQLDTIATTNPPYLGAALKTLKKTKGWDQLTPEQQLAAIQAKAAKAKQSAALAHYKQAKLKEKTPSKQAQEAFDALPDEAQIAITEQIEDAIKKKITAIAEEKAAIAAEKAAEAQLLDFINNPKGQTLKKKALEELANKDLTFLAKPAVEKLALVEEAAAAAQAKASQSAALSGYKAKLMQGKTPTPAQQKVFNSLTDKEKAAFFQKIKPDLDLVNEYEASYLAVYGKTPSANEMNGFIKSKKATKIEVVGFLDDKFKAMQAAKDVPDIEDALGLKTPDPVEEYKAAYKAAFGKPIGAKELDNFKKAGAATQKDATDHLKGIAGTKEVKPGDVAAMPPQTKTTPTPKTYHDLDQNQKYSVLYDMSGASEAPDFPLPGSTKWTISSGKLKQGMISELEQIIEDNLDNDILSEVNTYLAHKASQGKIWATKTPASSKATTKTAKAKAAPTSKAPTKTALNKKIEAAKNDALSFDIEDEDPLEWVFSKEFDPDIDADKWLKDVVADGLEDLGPDELFTKYISLLDQQASNLKPVKKVKKPIPPDGPIDAEDWSTKNLVKSGSQEGSNKGGYFKDEDTGITYYIKYPADADMARNEILANKLYHLAGSNAPDVTLIKTGDGIGVASRVIDDLLIDKDQLIGGKASGVYDDFVADAWLANWDVVGMSYDNLKVRAGKAYRIDPGGALRYRAQGGQKGAAFGNKVTEIESLRDASLNPQSAVVFKDITNTQITASAQRVINIPDQAIIDRVQRYGPLNTKERNALAKKLLARKADLAKRYGLELTPEAKAAKAEAVAVAQESVELTIGELNDKITTAIKGIAYRQSDGKGLIEKDITRVADVRAAYKALQKEMDNLLPDSKTDLAGYFESAISDLENAIKPGIGGAAKWDGGKFYGFQGKVAINDKVIKYEIPIPGQKKLFTAKQADNILKQNTNKTINSAVRGPNQKNPMYARMKKHHKLAVNAYTGSYYRNLNESLYMRKASKADREFRDLLNEGLELATPYRGMSARGLGLHGDTLKRWVDGHTNAAKTGKPVRYLAFTSSTKGSSAAFSGNIEIHIKSKRGVHVNDISTHSGGENEVLYRAGASFLVDSVKKRGEKYIIRLTEVDTDLPIPKELEFAEHGQ